MKEKFLITVKLIVILIIFFRHNFLLQNALYSSFLRDGRINCFFFVYSWDEWVPESRILKHNDQNIQKMKELGNSQQWALRLYLTIIKNFYFSIEKKDKHLSPRKWKKNQLKNQKVSFEIKKELKWLSQCSEKKKEKVNGWV